MLNRPSCEVRLYFLFLFPLSSSLAGREIQGKRKMDRRDIHHPSSTDRKPTRDVHYVGCVPHGPVPPSHPSHLTLGECEQVQATWPTLHWAAFLR
ncbi:uncharacterized protein LY79DRAFT_560946 [Colletotrichum navitas]|uniref:Secreted protein n=1 Tax=Colletotrichum navitas TaxID=681940 RepID=A0AAD8PTU7_9PEZI|nr:uncharacterized protein LY79DRAFT_560946 [Colletotrichum navitas]KAK1580609.1 hypothetical protein LY79DRAFT_560946 [Colletotrichum navitas]